MADSIPAVLCLLARSGVFVQWRDGKAVFKAAGAPPADIVALIDARKAEISAFLHPAAVRRRLEAEAEVLQTPRPPDVEDAQWQVAIHGLQAFLAAGHGDEAERLGWLKDDLYRVPKLWSQIHLCGVGLLIGDREVVGITPTEIRIKGPSDSTTAFRRRPQVDYRLVFETRLKLTQGNYADGGQEAHFRARDYTIGVYRSNKGCDLETAKAAVLSALKAKKEAQ